VWLLWVVHHTWVGFEGTLPHLVYIHIYDIYHLVVDGWVLVIWVVYHGLFLGGIESNVGKFEILS